MSFRRTPMPGRPVRDRVAIDPADERNQGTALTAAILVVATIVIGQLWGLTVALESWLDHHTSVVNWILAFQVGSFLVALGIWFAVPKGR
jgi:hypothetical protein